jgi:hypothetical protein
MSQDNTPALLREIQGLKGNSPKLMGYDYFHCIYGCAIALVFAMLSVYLVVEDPMIQKMVLGQGFLSLGLIASVYFFRSRLPKDAP